MALAAVQTAMNHERQAVHPFFSKQSKHHDSIPTPSTADILVENAGNDRDIDPDVDTSKKTKKRTRKTEGSRTKRISDASIIGQASMEKYTLTAKAPEGPEPPASNKMDTATIDDDLNCERSKRRKTASPPPGEDAKAPVPPVEHQASTGIALETRTRRHASPQVLVSGMPERPRTPVSIEENIIKSEAAGAGMLDAAPKAKATTPRKQMKVSKSGKLLSSPPKTTLDLTASPKKRRGRKPNKPKISPMVAVIKYGKDDESRIALGQRIEEILNRKKASSGKTSAPKKPVLNRPATPKKPSHPFFLGKAGSKKDAPPPKTQTEPRVVTPRKSAVTPGKLRAEARKERSPVRQPAFGSSSHKPRASKGPGIDAPWPTRENAHVRNAEESGLFGGSMPHTTTISSLGPRKLKRNVVLIPDKEQVMTRLGQDLAGISHRTSLVGTIRLPERLLTTGVEIQMKVSQQLKAQLPLQGAYQDGKRTTHLAITTLFHEIEHNLTPFDNGYCESQAWHQKYAPKCAAEVLQTGKETALLKDWLQSLTVMSVGGALRTSGPSDAVKPPKKKRRKLQDDFIVSDDEDEEEEMVECSDGEGRPGRSFRRQQWTRDKNVVVLSGPHGCGKSAAVYAVAKELDFEVFEINPGTRRSGKDIQDRVGDMTANHLVNHQRPVPCGKEALSTPEDTDNERMSIALREDLSSGRQGTMTSFFKARPAAQSKIKPKMKSAMKSETPKKAHTTSQAMLPLAQAQRKSQKQSLILFEEADILFDKDEQFWAQVSKLALSSKRPIVITCNDEQQIPSQILPLAATLRFSPPPIDLASDYMLVLAAREGHILQRVAVESLYRAKNFDLRASIADLDFWCQMSVGDKKGGLEWIYQRWPPGNDADEHGRPWRVASANTYQVGMGYFSHDIFTSSNNATFDRDEEIMKNAWADWGVSPFDWSADIPDARVAARPTEDQTVALLRDLDTVCSSSDFQSAVDVYCRVGLPTYNTHLDQSVDASMPEMKEKERANYTVMVPTLQVDHHSDFLNFDTSIYTYSQLLSQRLLQDQLQHTSTSGGQTESDIANMILQNREEKKHEQRLKLNRDDFAEAFDIIATPPDHMSAERTSYNLLASSFDREFRVITNELAPYVRSIALHEQALESQRLSMSSLLSAGGNGKRSRTTRAARTALEGGVRELKRRERWFDPDLNLELVLRTGGKEWAGLGYQGAVSDGDEMTGSAASPMEGVMSTAEGTQEE